MDSAADETAADDDNDIRCHFDAAMLVRYNETLAREELRLEICLYHDVYDHEC